MGSTRRPCRYGCGRKAENEHATRCRTCRRNDKTNQQGKSHRAPRILFVDIETSPNVVYTWGLWNQNIGLNQIIETTRMLCFAAKWAGDEDVQFFSEWQHGREGMVRAAWAALDNADVVVHYYGSRFDVPHLNREFIEAGLTPPSPYKQVDLKVAVAKRFKLPSNKLEFVSQVLKLDGKVKHEGFGLWKGVLDGEEGARRRMAVYNIRDVELLEEVYERLLPWIPGVPSRLLYGGDGCPACGSPDIHLVGPYRTKLSAFAQYRCVDCGSFSRDSKRLYGVDIQEAVL